MVGDRKYLAIIHESRTGSTLLADYLVALGLAKDIDEWLNTHSDSPYRPSCRQSLMGAPYTLEAWLDWVEAQYSGPSWHAIKGWPGHLKPWLDRHRDARIIWCFRIHEFERAVSAARSARAHVWTVRKGDPTPDFPPPEKVVRSALQLVEQHVQNLPHFFDIATNRTIYCVVYEDLVARPERTLLDLGEWLGEPWTPEQISEAMGSHRLSVKVGTPISPSEIVAWLYER